MREGTFYSPFISSIMSSVYGAFSLVDGKRRRWWGRCIGTEVLGKLDRAMSKVCMNDRPLFSYDFSRETAH